MPKFKSLDNKSAIEAQVTDHEPLIHPSGTVSVNIMGNQMRGIAPNAAGFPNNGFNKTETPDEHLKRLNLVAKMLGELAENPTHKIFTLQEVPLPTSPAFGPFIESLKQTLPEFDIENALFRQTGSENFGQAIICKKGLKLQDISDTIVTPPNNQRNRVLTARIFIDDPQKKYLMEYDTIANVHLKYDSPAEFSAPTSNAETTKYINECLKNGVSVVGDFNRNVKKLCDPVPNVGDSISSNSIFKPSDIPVSSSIYYDKNSNSIQYCHVDVLLMSVFSPLNDSDAAMAMLGKAEKDRITSLPSNIFTIGAAKKIWDDARKTKAYSSSSSSSAIIKPEIANRLSRDQIEAIHSQFFDSITQELMWDPIFINDKFEKVAPYTRIYSKGSLQGAFASLKFDSNKMAEFDKVERELSILSNRIAITVSGGGTATPNDLSRQAELTTIYSRYALERKQAAEKYCKDPINPSVKIFPKMLDQATDGKRAMGIAFAAAYEAIIATPEFQKLPVPKDILNFYSADPSSLKKDQELLEHYKTKNPILQLSNIEKEVLLKLQLPTIQVAQQDHKEMWDQKSALDRNDKGPSSGPSSSSPSRSFYSSSSSSSSSSTVPVPFNDQADSKSAGDAASQVREWYKTATFGKSNAGGGFFTCKDFQEAQHIFQLLQQEGVFGKQKMPPTANYFAVGAGELKKLEEFIQSMQRKIVPAQPVVYGYSSHTTQDSKSAGDAASQVREWYKTATFGKSNAGGGFFTCKDFQEAQHIFQLLQQEGVFGKQKMPPTANYFAVGAGELKKLEEFIKRSFGPSK